MPQIASNYYIKFLLCRYRLRAITCILLGQQQQRSVRVGFTLCGLEAVYLCDMVVVG